MVQSAFLQVPSQQIYNTAEFFAFFVSTGQFASYSNQRKIDILPFIISTRLTPVDFHFT